MPLDVARVRARLLERRIEWFETIDSTMTAAAKLAAEGCAHGTIVGADEQTAGAGRHGHAWLSERDSGLYVSIVLRLPVEARALPVAMLALGLAARDAIVEVSRLAPDLRWPNDILIGGKKCAGILARVEGGAVIAGIGVNVNQTTFPEDLATPAISLAMAGAAVAREDLLIALAQAVERYGTMLQEAGAAAILRLFEASSSYARNRRVRVEQPAGAIEGVTGGLDPSGFLILRRDNGQQTTIFAGGVRQV